VELIGYTRRGVHQKSSERYKHPCPCGYLGDSAHPCSCPPIAVQRYRSKITGPLLDRIDIQIEVPAVKFKVARTIADLDRSEHIRE